MISKETEERLTRLAETSEILATHCDVCDVYTLVCPQCWILFCSSCDCCPQKLCDERQRQLDRYIDALEVGTETSLQLALNSMPPEAREAYYIEYTIGGYYGLFLRQGQANSP